MRWFSGSGFKLEDLLKSFDPHILISQSDLIFHLIFITSLLTVILHSDWFYLHLTQGGISGKAKQYKLVVNF